MQRLIDEGIRTELISESLFLLTATTPADEAAAQLKAKGFDFCGVDQAGEKPSFVERSQLESGSVSDHATEILESRIIESDLPLWFVLRQIVTQEVLFVSTKGVVDSIVTIADLDKQPSRLMLFGIVSMMEMVMYATITAGCESEIWPTYLSENRRAAYERIHRDRLEKNQELDPLSCTQLCDKLTIICKHNDLYTHFGLSKNKLRELTDRIGTIRDNLAHAHPPAQGIEWHDIVGVVELAHGIITKFPKTYLEIQIKQGNTQI